MGTVPPPHRVNPRQPQIELVDEGRRLQCMTLALVAHVVVGEPAQLFVNDRHESISRSGITVGPVGKDLGYALALGGIGVMGHRFHLPGHSSPPPVSPEASPERLLRRKGVVEREG